MSLTQEQIKVVANLARLELQDGEVEKYTNELNKILSYIQSLEKVDTEGVAPLFGIKSLSGEGTPLRQDILGEELEGNAEPLAAFREFFTKNAPDTEGRFFKVPKMGKE